MQINQRLLVVGAAALLSACTSVATISSVQSGTVVSLREHAVTTPGQQPLKSTSFTNFEFKAIEPGNDQPLYGVLPLEFRGGHLALDILFFAPGAFLNLRTASPYYEFDVSKNVVRYKSNANDAWTEYHPSPAETERAKTYFEAKAAAAGVSVAGSQP